MKGDIGENDWILKQRKERINAVLAIRIMVIVAIHAQSNWAEMRIEDPLQMTYIDGDGRIDGQTQDHVKNRRD